MAKSYEELTNIIIEHIESNPKQWESGLSGIAQSMPVNHEGAFYNGINILLLWISAEKQGFSSNQWMTYKQAKDKGAHVKKGAKGTHIIFYKTYEKENSEGEKDTIPVMRSYTVFNREQIEGLPEQKGFKLFNWEPIQAGENLKLSSDCEIQQQNVIPCYNLKLDVILIPEKARFNTAENYYTTLAHEMIHSTMHKTRLDRESEKGKKGYAFEELIAELGAVFTCSKLNIHGDIENHASYIKSWLQHMKDDSKYIFRAASQATKASDYLLSDITAEAFAKGAKQQ